MTDTQTEDPWAAAATDDGHAGDAELSFEDEFGESGSAEEAVGSSLPPGTKLPGFPKLSQLYGRLLIVEPVSYDPAFPTYAAKFSGATGDVEEVFKVKLVVLDGDPITVPEIEKQEDGSWKKTGEKVSPEFPVVFYGLNVNQGRLVGQLKKKFNIETGEKIDGGKWLGRLRRSANRTFSKVVTSLPFPAQYDRCDEIAANYRIEAQAALAAGEQPEAAPKFSPMISSYSPADAEIAKRYLVADKAERAARKNAS
jgi:hypothetical protein